MIPLYTQTEFNNSNNTDKLLLICKQCNNKFMRTKKRIKDALNPNLPQTNDFCSRRCKSNSEIKYVKVNCLTCNLLFTKTQSEIKRTNNHFCTRSCAASYNNKHKTHGTRRSKLEIYLEKQLKLLYPNLEIHFNQKSAINSELDIYVPSLNLAFELNGIFHYEPIYGLNKLGQIQNNDISKSKACYDAKIDLCIIDTSSQKNFKLSTSNKFLDIIVNIINQRTFC
jgi:hypothetical protein